MDLLCSIQCSWPLLSCIQVFLKKFEPKPISLAACDLPASLSVNEFIRLDPAVLLGLYGQCSGSHHQRSGVFGLPAPGSFPSSMRDYSAVLCCLGSIQIKFIQDLYRE